MARSNAVSTIVTKRELSEMPFEDALEAYSPNFEAVLPPEMTLEHFKRIVVTAVNINPDLRYADRRTFFNACVKCASDGLYPDGREAALVVYKTKIKRRRDTREVEEIIDAVQYMPMIAGIRKRLRNSGDVVSAIAEVVYKNDGFRYRKGVDQHIEHEPAPLDVDPGQPIGAYAIITLRSGERIIDVMRRHEIEQARHQGRAKDSLMWTKFWGEGARKTVLRRCAKAAPQQATMATLQHLLDRDEEPPVSLPPPPRPDRAQFVEPPADDDEIEEVGIEEEVETFSIVAPEGEIRDFATPGNAVGALAELLRAAPDAAARAALWADNETVIETFSEADKKELRDLAEPAEPLDTPEAIDRALRKAAATGHLRAVRQTYLGLNPEMRSQVPHPITYYEDIARDTPPPTAS